MASKGFENLEVYRVSEELADAIWRLVVRWDEFSKRSVGSQLVRAADSIGANIAEGTGRGSYKDNKHFARIARGSLNEARHFLRRAFHRNLLSQEQIDELKPLIRQLGPQLNAYIKSIGRAAPATTPRPASDQ